MLELASSIKDEFTVLLNSSAFTTDSIEGWIIIILCIWLAYEISQKAVKVVGWLVSVIFLFQVCHWLSFTSLNDIIPLSNWFQYDLLTAVAQCFVGTKLCDILLWANAYIHTICSSLWEVLTTGKLPI